MWVAFMLTKAKKRSLIIGRKLRTINGRLSLSQKYDCEYKKLMW